MFFLCTFMKIAPTHSSGLVNIHGHQFYKITKLGYKDLSTIIPPKSIIFNIDENLISWINNEIN